VYGSDETEGESSDDPESRDSRTSPSALLWRSGVKRSSTGWEVGLLLPVSMTVLPLSIDCVDPIVLRTFADDGDSFPSLKN
jgi:hypothetical protein